MKTLVVLLGPTCVGKTVASLALAEHLGVPIINADSRQIFRELPIGTAAPRAEELARVRHYFVGTKSVADYYSAAQYEADVLSLLDELFVGSDVALMCGGSMMYIDAVCEGIDDIPTVSPTLREELKERLATEGLSVLLEELRCLDPDYYAIVDHRNPRRVVHALEVCRTAGRPYSSFRRGQKKSRPFAIVKIGLTRKREELYARINQRVLDMVAAGLVDEARSVYPLRRSNALNAVGYRELFRHFDGEINLAEAVRQIQSHTRQYMRKQMTWFLRDQSICWLHPDDDIISRLPSCR